MAVITMQLERVEITIITVCKVDQLPIESQEVPGGLYPMVARAFEMDEYRVMAGWPVAIPKYEIRAETMVSANGEYFTDRDDPTAITTGAVLRWVADEALFDELALEWRTIQNSTGQPVTWKTSVQYAPILIDDYTYRVKNEVFKVQALNFDSDNQNHMWCDLSTTIGGAAGYTLIMVMSPNSTFGNDISVPYNGLWYPGEPTPLVDTFSEETGDHWFGVSCQNNSLYMETEVNPRTRGISIYPELNSNAPMMVAMVFDRPETVFYVGPGPSAIRVKSLPAGSNQVALSNQVVLGRSTGDRLHTADMALLDLGIYPNTLNAPEVADEFALLSQAYGGDS
jgi:hypothetical protein